MPDVLRFLIGDGRHFVGCWVALGDQLKSFKDTVIKISRHIGGVELLQRTRWYFIGIVVGFISSKFSPEFIASVSQPLSPCTLTSEKGKEVAFEVGWPQSTKRCERGKLLEESWAWLSIL